MIKSFKIAKKSITPRSVNKGSPGFTNFHNKSTVNDQNDGDGNNESDKNNERNGPPLATT